MSTIVYDQKDRLLAWARPHIETGDLPVETYAIGHARGDEILAVVLYTWFTDHNCAMHVASNGRADWMSRGFLAAAFAYPFIQLGLRRVTAYVASRNERALTIDGRLGFRVEGVMKQAAGDDDLIVMGLLREHCLWIPEEYRHG